MKSLSRAILLLKSVGLDHTSQVAAAALACHLEGKLSGASDTAVVDLLRSAVGPLKAAFSLKNTAAVDPVAAVALAVKIAANMQTLQIAQEILGIRPEPIEPVAPVEAVAPVEPVAEVEPVVEVKPVGKAARAK